MRFYRNEFPMAQQEEPARVNSAMHGRAFQGFLVRPCILLMFRGRIFDDPDNVAVDLHP